MAPIFTLYDLLLAPGPQRAIRLEHNTGPNKFVVGYRELVGCSIDADPVREE